MTDIVFVILNYNLFDTTKNCVDSICRNIDTDHFKIVIIDNASKTNAGESLKKYYKQNDKVYVQINQSNLGFARGNNVGIQIARSYDPKYICCLNNDTVFVQTDFFSVLDNFYSNNADEGIALIGPKILLRDGRVQYTRNGLLSVEEYRKIYNSCEQKIQKVDLRTKLQSVLMSNRFVYEINSVIKHWNRIVNTPQKNIVLHGCCLIFTPIFWENMDGFDPRTFLYCEEDLLLLNILRHRLKSQYLPTLFISHLEDMSTNFSVDSSKRDEFKKNHLRDSLAILIDEIKKTQEKSGTF